MARYRGIWRLCYGWCLLCCVLPTVEAATRVPVTLPSVQAQVEGAGAAAVVGGALQVSTPPLVGELLLAGEKNLPVRGILGGTTFGLNTITAGAKGILRGGVATVLAGAAFDQLIKGVGWLIDGGGNISKPGSTPGGVYQGAPHQYGTFTWTNNTQFFTIVKADTNDIPGCQYTSNNDPYFGFVCSYASATLPASQPLVSSDIDGISVDQFISAQNSDFVRNLLKEVCQGSLAPARCYDSMKQQALVLQGPSTVPGETTTKTTTIANPDGTTSSVVTTDNSTYNLTYGPDYFDYSKTTQSNTATNGKPTSSTTTSDTPADPNSDPEKQQPSDPVASPCGINCDGPAYQKLYEPTKDTKEQALDSYASRVANLPILKAATGFFNVSVGGGCPVWQVNTSLEVMSASMPINLIFDFHCQGWFTSVASYASAVMAIVCAFLAFRQAFLD